MVIRIEVKGLDDVYRLTRDLPEKVDKALNDSNFEFMKNVRRTSKFKCPKSSGEASRGLKIERTKTRGKRNQYKLVATKPYTYWIIHGRRPGRKPPVQELMKWRKLDPSKAGQTDRFAAALKLSEWIGRHGTKPNDFVGRALEHNLVKFDMIINERFKQIA